MPLRARLHTEHLAHVARLAAGSFEEPSPEAAAGGILNAEMAGDIHWLKRALESAK